jgi:DNA-binding IclR family transcriptional regulator
MVTARDRPPEEAAEDTSFARGLRVLLTIADRGDIKADELATLLDTPLSTIYRYLRTLTEFGFIERQEGGYRLGPRLHISGGPTITSEELIRVAGPVLETLAEETGETAVIARRIGTTAVCLHEVRSIHPLLVTCEPGTVLPLGAGAVSRVLLAFAPDDVRDVALDGTTGVRALRRDLAAIVREGLAQGDGEPPGTTTIAVPVIQADGIVAAVAVLAPTSRTDRAWRARTTHLLLDASASIVADLRTGQAQR